MTIDARGMLCPWPAIRLARAIRQGGGHIEIIADDPRAAAELADVATAAGWSLTCEASRFVAHPPSA